MLEDKQAVAVKFLHPTDVASTASHREKFESEIKIMRLCAHESIVACIGACVRPVRL